MDSLARTEGKSKRPTIGLLINDFSLAYQVAIGEGIFDAAARTGVNLLSFASGNDHDPRVPVSNIFELVGAQNVDGLIITSPIIASFRSDSLQRLVERCLSIPTISLGDNRIGIPSVSAEEEKALQGLISHLVNAHHRQRIVFLQGIHGNTDAENRYQIYLRALETNNLPFDPRLVVAGEFRFETAREAINNLLNQDGLCFDAIVAANDYMALGALDVLRTRNISVPDQVSVTGFDDIEESSFAWSPLTTVRQPIYEQGQCAVELLLDKLQGKDIPHSTYLPTQMIVRQSCGCFSKDIIRVTTERRGIAGDGLEAVRQELMASLTFVKRERLDELIAAFWAHLNGEKDFLAILQKALNESIAEQKPVVQWQSAISDFRKLMLPLVPTSKRPAAENLWHQTRILISEAAQREQAYRQVAMQENMLMWRDLSSRIAALSSLTILASTIKEVFPRIGVKRCYVSLYNFTPGEVAPANQSSLILAHDAQRVELNALADSQPFPTNQLLPLDMLPEDQYNFVIEPLFRQEETEIGFALIELTSYDWAAYDALKNHLASALKTTTLIQELVDRGREREQFIQTLAHRAEQVSTIMRVGQVANSFLDLESLLQRVVREVQVAFNYDAVAIYLFDPVRNSLIQSSTAGRLNTTVTSSVPLDAPALVSEVARSHQLINSDDQEVGIPLLVDSGIRLIGVLDIQNNRSNAFSTEDLETLFILANQVAIAIHNAELFDASEKARQSANEAKRLAEEANKAKSEFLANMSHELRTPLNAILGFAQLMGRDGSLSATQHENIEIILRSGEHLLELINDVLEMSKIEAGRVGLIEVDFDLSRLLQGLEEMFRFRAERKNLRLRFEGITNVPQFVRSDEGKLRQVLINLLGNAIKFTDQGSVVFRVRFQGDRTDTTNPQHLYFEIEDTGRGIPPEEITTIFNPFVQAKTPRKIQEGTGLGLSISRRFVELMGGEISVESVVGQKSVFRFDIEVTLTTSAAVESYQEGGRVLGLEPGQNPYRVLVVEDRWENRNLLLRLLTAVGFEVREATNGEEGIDVYQQWKPDLIFMDMQMPIMDGYTATKHIKADPGGTRTVIIAVTASAFKHERDMIIQAGCDDFLIKPYRETSVFAKLEQHLKVRFIRQEDEQRPATPISAEISPASLAAFPPEWITEMDKAARRADAKRLKELIERIRAEDSTLASALTELVKAYRFDKIRSLTEGVKSIPN